MLHRSLIRVCILNVKKHQYYALDVWICFPLPQINWFLLLNQFIYLYDSLFTFRRLFILDSFVYLVLAFQNIKTCFVYQLETQQQQEFTLLVSQLFLILGPMKKLFVIDAAWSSFIFLFILFISSLCDVEISSPPSLLSPAFSLFMFRTSPHKQHSTDVIFFKNNIE